MRVEVRCCCQPTKLLGWLDVPHELIFAGNVIRFLIPPRADYAAGVGTTFKRQQRIGLPVEVLREGGQQWLALKSEETAIEVLRQIPDFIEAV